MAIPPLSRQCPTLLTSKLIALRHPQTCLGRYSGLVNCLSACPFIPSNGVVVQCLWQAGGGGGCSTESLHVHLVDHERCQRGRVVVVGALHVDKCFKVALLPETHQGRRTKGEVFNGTRGGWLVRHRTFSQVINVHHDHGTTADYSCQGVVSEWNWKDQDISDFGKGIGRRRKHDFVVTEGARVEGGGGEEGLFYLLSVIIITCLVSHPPLVIHPLDLYSDHPSLGNHHLHSGRVLNLQIFNFRVTWSPVNSQTI